MIGSIQETHFKDQDQYNFNIAGYSLYTNNVNSFHRKGGVALYISDSLIHRAVPIDTEINAVAAEVIINNKPILIASVYIPPDRHSFHSENLRTLINKLLRRGPLLLMGDLNAHHQLWGCENNSARGSEVDAIFNDFELICLNDGNHTFLSSSNGTRSAIDLAASSPSLSAWFQFTVHDDLIFSDHFPILLHFTFSQSLLPPPRIPCWSMKRADWACFRKAVEDEAEEMENNDISDLLSIISKAAEACIPITGSHRRRQATPWWTPECSHAVAKRKRALRSYQKYICTETRVTYLIASRHCRAVLLRAKKASWRSFVSSFNRTTPLSQIWQIIKAFTNKRDPITAFPQLVTDGVTHVDPNEVVQKFADYYANVSSYSNYPLEQHLHFDDLLHSCDISLDSSEDYNKPFTSQELSAAINQSGNTSVGPDGIHYEFFRQLSSTSMEILLDCFNEAWMKGTFPDEWLHSFIVPILKPGKSRTDPASYRPIYLTSCACKLFERLVNQRLRYFLDTSSKLDNFQSGFRKGRTSADNLIRITTAVQRGFQEKQHTVAVFLDLASAYDRVHPSALLYLVHKIGIRGNLAVFIRNFLRPRTFQVRVRTFLSSPTTKKFGIPQGSVISPTLFLIMINDIASNINTLFRHTHHSIFADDVALWCVHKSIDRAAQILQESLYKVSEWCDLWGLKISVDKSVSVVFTKRNTSMPRLSTPLYLKGETIPELSFHTFLGITLDSRLTFRIHASRIRLKAQRRLNIIRALSCTQWGGDRKTLTLLFTSLVRSTMEYNSFIYTYLARSNQERIETIQNAALRSVTGALRTTPVCALLAETNSTPLAMRSQIALFKYFLKSKTIDDHPTSPCFSTGPEDFQDGAFTHTPPVGVQIHRLSAQYEIDVCDFKIAARPPPTPFWLFSPPNIQFLFHEAKSSTIAEDVLSRFNEFKANHSSYAFYYTDGSKSEDSVASAFCGPTQKIFRLPPLTSIFSAELHAVLQALVTIKSREPEDVVICSDSKAALIAIKSSNPSSMLVHQIQLTTRMIMQRNKIIFLWVPGHVGIPGNRKADQLAKSGLQKEKLTNIPLTPEEAMQPVKAAIHKRIQLLWDAETKGRHMHSIKPQIREWSTSFHPSRKREVVIARLRMGHTFLTHSYLFDSNRDRPECNDCKKTLTISHVLLECPKYHLNRIPLIQFASDLGLSLSLPLLLGNDHPALLDLLSTFLEQSQILHAF